MHILFLTHYFEPDITSNAVIATGLAKQLVELGHQVTVVTSVPHYDQQRIPPAFRRVIVRRTVEMDARLKVWRTWVLIPRNKRSTVQRFISYFSYNFMSLVLLPVVGRYDIVLTMSPPLTNGIVAYLACILRRVPFVYNVQDLFPDLPIELGLVKNQSLIKFLYRLEAFVYRKAASLTVLSNEMQDKILSKDVPASKVAVIPNFVDVDFIIPSPKDNPWSREHGLSDKFVMMYTGNIGSVQSVDVLVETADLLRDNAQIHFAIVGDGVAKEQIIARAQELSLSNISFLPLQPRENLPNLFASADMLLVSLRKGVAGHSVPSKTYTIMASGRPILASVEANNAVRSIVEQADCGFHVPPEDPTALAAVIRQVASDSELGQVKGKNGRRYVEKHYSASRIAHQYHELLVQLTQDKSQP